MTARRLREVRLSSAISGTPLSRWSSQTTPGEATREEVAPVADSAVRRGSSRWRRTFTVEGCLWQNSRLCNDAAELQAQCR